MIESTSNGGNPAPVPASAPAAGPAEPARAAGTGERDGGSAAGEDSQPAPVLVFRLRRYAHKPGDEGPRALALATLEFDYGDKRVSGAGRGEGASEPRSRGAELAAEERLEALGMTPLAALGEVAAALAQPAQPNEWVLPRPRGVAPSSRLLRLMPRLEAEGFRLEFHKSFPFEVLPPPESWYGELSGDEGRNGFELALGVLVRGERIPLAPAIRRGLADGSLTLEAGPRESDDAVWLAPIDARRRVPLALVRVRAVLGALGGALTHAGTGEVIALPRAGAAVLNELSDEDDGAGVALSGRADLTRLAARLAAPGSTVHQAPSGLTATLRAYQLDGLAWLAFLADCGLGGVLADDMGLGKTVQVLAHILAEREAGRLRHPALVVVPTSLVPNWRDEVQRFAPDLKLAILHGAQRESEYQRLERCDVALTTYALLVRDRERLSNLRFSLLVLDEAQAIKNARSKSAEAARGMNAERKLAVTGTPLENHLGELWSLFDCALPGLLGSEADFARFYRAPIERHDDVQVRARLHRRTAPFVLRRTKEQVAPELPLKSVIERRIELGLEQRLLYESRRAELKTRLGEAVQAQGFRGAQMLVLEALLRLRQICCDPRLVGAQDVDSAKLEVLLEMLEELVGAGRRILVYSQFTRMLDLIQHELAARAIAHARLDGATRDRESPVARFQSGDIPVFLISLKAGGVGLNLTQADTVIHYDPWWNPAAENQAADRAHRIGQDKPIFVYRLICAGTVEERVRALQARKAALARGVLEGGTSQSLVLEPADLEELLAPLA